VRSVASVNAVMREPLPPVLHVGAQATMAANAVVPRCARIFAESEACAAHQVRIYSYPVPLPLLLYVGTPQCDWGLLTSSNGGASLAYLDLNVTLLAHLPFGRVSWLRAVTNTWRPSSGEPVCNFSLVGGTK